MRLILASTSPRRKEILALLGLPFEVVAPNFEERVSDQAPIEEEVVSFALGKAQSVASENPRSTVIGSDTMILLEGAKIGKPADIDGARRMLRSLAGRRHEIYTGVAIIDEAGAASAALIEKVSIRMRPFGEREIERYLAYGESLDKAGAYSIQGEGRELIAAMEGDYLAAVGLPLKPIVRYFASRGMPVSRDVEQLYETKDFMNWRSFD
jgi:nucleoside triphosphate pyrophosphatase